MNSGGARAGASTNLKEVYNRLYEGASTKHVETRHNTVRKTRQQRDMRGSPELVVTAQLPGNPQEGLFEVVVTLR